MSKSSGITRKVVGRDLKAAASASLLWWLLACAHRGAAHQDGAAHFENTRVDVTQAIADYPLFSELETDGELTSLFKRYITWVASLEVPDAVLVVHLMDSPDRTLDAWATAFHEQVEFKGWLDLGHRFEDILTVPYYQAQYDRVYPVAHRKAIIEEFLLIKHFARKQRFRDLPVLAYALVSPLVERHQATAARLVRRLKYNPEYLSAPVSEQELELAVRVFEIGGYRYQDRAGILDGARAYLKHRDAPP